MNVYLIYAIGFFSQVLFFARNIAQWFLSEKKGEIVSPVIYWQISLAASILMLIYGILRNDFAIVLGQIIVYFIYIRNLQLKKMWGKLHFAARIFIFIIPLVYIAWFIFGDKHNFRSLFRNEDISVILMVWGTAGQVIFTFRFIYQWLYSEKRNASFLPVGFWIISTAGSLMIFIYAIFRLDPVLFAAHSLGMFIYIRNILLHSGSRSLFSRLDNFPLLNQFIKKMAGKLK